MTILLLEAARKLQMVSSHGHFEKACNMQVSLSRMWTPCTNREPKTPKTPNTPPTNIPQHPAGLDAARRTKALLP